MASKLRPLILLVALLGLIAASCGGGDESTDSASDTATETTAADEATDTTAADDAAATDDTAAEAGSEDGAMTDGEGVRVALVLPGEINDVSWNQQMYTGAQSLVDEGLVSEVAYTELVPEGDAERTIRGYAEDGFDLIVAHSFGYGEAAKAVAADFPDTAFAWAGGIGGQENNVADYEQPFHQAYYLMGILAGGASESGVLGGAGGFDIPACHSLVEAFYLGAQEVNPDASGVTTYTGDWIDVAVAKEAAAAAAAQGADVFGACGEGPVLGQIEQARDQGLLATGYVGDMATLAPEAVLASMVWNTAELLRPMVNDIAAGSFSPAKYYSVGVADDGLVVAINPDLADRVSDKAMELYDTRLAEIKDGSFEVPYIPE